jgi:hypothetical protein
MATVADLIAQAKAQLGKPYVFGAEGPGSFDCSGLMQYVYAAIGIKLPRTAAEQQRAAAPVAAPQPGDLVFWGNPAYHVALYVGDGYQIAAPQPGDVVKLQKVYGSPTYGRVASLDGGGGFSATLTGLTGNVVNASFSMDKFFKQVEGVSLQLALSTLGLALVGFGLWKVTSPARNKVLDEAKNAAF